MNKHDTSKISIEMKARKRKYKLRKPGSKFERMILRILANTDFSNLLVRMSEARIQEVISMQLTLEEYKIIAVHPKPIRVLLEVPQKTDALYIFCPDERIRTHRLLGKPALGLSPPQLN